VEYEDFNIRSPQDQSPTPPEFTPTPKSPAPRIIAALLVVAVGVTGYFVFRNRFGARESAPASAPATAAPTQEPATSLGTEAEVITIPPLDESDDAVRELVAKLSSQPSVMAWLASKNLIRTFTTVVSNIANGERAAGLVPSLKPKAAFQVEDRGEEIYLDPRSYSRYLPLTTAATSVDPAAVARLYATLKPRIEEAYRELGYPDTPFDQTLERALVLLIKTPVPQGRVPLQVKGATFYRFADPALERLTPSQKLLIRFGPDNQRAVQTSLRQIAMALGIAEEKLR